jgi:iron complex outermembrane receptor protein
LLLSLSANAQTALPGLVIEQPKPAPQSKPRRKAATAEQVAVPPSTPVTPAAALAPEAQSVPSGFPGGAARSGALSVATTQEAIRELATVPGAVTVVPDDYKDTTSAKTIKDALDYVPGVFVQPKWGDDTRLSLYAEGRNLTDEAYIASVSITDNATPASTLFEPGTGRAVYAGMKYRW